MTATTPTAPPSALSPSAEPQIYVGIITSILVSAGLVTTGEATTLQPLLLAMIVVLPTVLAIIQRQFATPNARVAETVQAAVIAATSTPPVTTAPVNPLPAPVTTSTGSTSVTDTVTSPGVLDEADVAALERYIAALEAKPDKTPDDLAKLATYQARLTSYQARLAAAAAASTPIVPPAPTPLDPSAPYLGNPAVSIADAAAIDAQGQAQKVAPNGGPISPTVAAYDGAALKYGFNGVIGVANAGEFFYVVFLAGRIVGMVQGGPTTDTVALARQYGLAGDKFGTLTP